MGDGGCLRNNKPVIINEDYYYQRARELMLKRKASNQPKQTLNVQEMDSGTHPTYPLDADYRHLLQLVESLDEKDSQIVMAHLHGFNRQEIARMTGLSLPTVARRLAKAKKWLKKNYYEE